jgi:hypothetical protein
MEIDYCVRGCGDADVEGRLCECGSAVGALARKVFAHLHATMCMRMRMILFATMHPNEMNSFSTQ